MSIIAPHFEYCSSILFLANAEDLNRLQKLQNRAMRIILHCSRYTKITLMLDTLQWLSIKQRIVFNTIIFIFKIIHNLLPNCLLKYIIQNSEIHNYPTRNCEDFKLPFRKRNYTQNSLFYKGLKVYNDLSRDVKNETNIVRFRRNLSSFVKENF